MSENEMQSSEVISPEPESKSQETPPTKIPPITPIENPPAPVPAPNTDKYVKALEDALRDQQRQIQEFQNASTRKEPEAKTELSAEDARQQFFTNPLAVLNERDARLLNDMRETIKPLIEVAKSFRGDGTPYGKLKNRFKANPQYAQLLSDPLVEQAVDKIMESADPTDPNMLQAVLSAVGMKSAGMLGMLGIEAPTPAPVSPSPNGNTIMTSPAHLRPSAPPLPNPASGKPAQRQLTENEKRICRERNMSEADFLAWMDVPPSQVVNSKIGLITPPVK